MSVTEEELEVHVIENHDGMAPAWVASARGSSCGSEYSLNDAVAALIEQLLKTGVITEDEAAAHVVAEIGAAPSSDGAGGRLLNRPSRGRSRDSF